MCCSQPHAQAAEDAIRTFSTFLDYSFTPGRMIPKFEPTRPAKSIGPFRIGIATAQELRSNLDPQLHVDPRSGPRARQLAQLH
jgi:hypothetical protein